MKKKISIQAAPPVPDMVQTTVLVDRSGSMSDIWSSVLSALNKLRSEIDCSLFSVQFFNDDWEIAKDFDDPNQKQINTPEGMTNLYGSIIKSIKHSREVSQITPEYRAHHVFVVITDGESNMHGTNDLAECKKQVAAMDVDATYFLLDSTDDQIAGKGLDWLSTPFKNTPKGVIDAINKVKLTVNQLTENVAKKLPPTSNLLLPPAVTRKIILDDEVKDKSKKKK